MESPGNPGRFRKSTWRLHVACLFLGLVGSTCSEPTAATKTPFVFVEHLGQADAVFDPIQFRSVRKDALLALPITLGSETQSSLTPPLPSRLTYEVEIPPHPVMHFSIGATPLGDGPLDAQVDFLLYVDPGNGEVLSFSDTVERHQPNQWFDRSADLSQWSGKVARLTFETKPRLEELPSTQVPILAAWGDPVLASSAARPEKPNVILISIDCLRADHVGAYGYHRATTPNIDRFAEDGVVFETAVATSSWTLPTHMSMLTGFLPSFHGATKWEQLDRPVAYLPELLSESGYQTTGVASWVYVSQVYGFERGFDIYQVVEKTPLASDVVDIALAQLRRKKGQSHFLFMHLLDPHWPYLGDVPPDVEFGVAAAPWPA